MVQDGTAKGRPLLQEPCCSAVADLQCRQGAYLKAGAEDCLFSTSVAESGCNVNAQHLGVVFAEVRESIFETFSFFTAKGLGNTAVMEQSPS